MLSLQIITLEFFGKNKPLKWLILIHVLNNLMCLIQSIDMAVCHLQICEVQIRFCSMWKVCSFAQFVLRTILLNENIKNNLDCEHIVYYFFVCLFIFFPQSQFTELNPGSGGVYSAKIHDGIRETLSGYGI